MNSSIIKDVLEKSKLNKSFIGLWLYTDKEGFYSGYVTDYNDEVVQIQSFNKYGKPDGIIIEQIENIETIDYNDDYAESMKYVVENAYVLDKEEELSQVLSNGENWKFDFLNQHIGKGGYLVGISIDEGLTYSGFVHQLDQKNVVLHVIGKLGVDEGYTVFKLNDIESVVVNDIEYRLRLLLHNWRKTR